VCFVELVCFAFGDGFAIALDLAFPVEFPVAVLAYLAEKQLAMGNVLPSVVAVPFAAAVVVAAVGAAVVVVPSGLESPVDP
jgi:hypothetical protein